MTPEAWSRIRREFEALLEQDASAREARLQQLHAEDASLASEVRSLLDADAKASGFLEHGKRQPPTEALNDGTQLGPYRIVKELGRGGMGTVFLAQRADDTFSKKVAIKVVSRGLESSGVLERFTAERRILATLEHPNIARLIDAGSTPDGRPWFAMDYIEGQSLTQWCRTRELTLKQRVELMRGVCLAVQFAHQRLVVHRDLKPSNILVSADGVPHLLDFGLARVLGEDGDGKQTATQHRWLTPDYASPEQIRGERVTTSSDVHGLGLLLYEVLTGAHPLRRETPSQTMAAICEAVPSAPSATGRTQTRGDGWSDLDAITLMALRKEPEARYATAEQLADELGRWLEGQPVRARSGSTRYRLGRFVRRNRGSVFAAVLVASSLVGGFITTLWQARVAEQERARAQRRFEEMRDFASRTLFVIQDAVQEVPGATKAGALVIQRSTELLDELAKEAGDDLELRRELGRSYTRLGTILSSANSSGVVGDVKASQHALLRALEFQEPLAALGGDEDVRDLAMTQMRLADTAFNLGATEEADRWAKLSLQNARRLKSPERKFRTQLAGSLQEYAALARRLNHFKEARDAIREEREVLEALLVQFPGDEWLSMSLFATYRIESSILRKADDVRGAIEVARVAVERGRTFLEQHPSRAARRNLSIAEIALAHALFEDGQKEASLGYYQSTLALRRTLAADDPADNDAAYLLLEGESEVVDCLRSLGRYDEALELVPLAEAHAEAQATRDLSAATTIEECAGFEQYVAEVYAERKKPGDVARAREWLLKAKARLEALHLRNAKWNVKQLEEVDARLGELK